MVTLFNFMYLSFWYFEFFFQLYLIFQNRRPITKLHSEKLIFWPYNLQVTYTLLALVRAYQVKALEWAKECITLIPKTAVTEIESSRLLQALSDAASGASVNTVMIPIEELSDVCRRNRTVQEIVQDALKPLELNMVQRV